MVYLKEKEKKRITMQGHRFRQKPKLRPDYEVIARGFHEKRSGNDYMNRGKELLAVVGYSFSNIQGWLLILRK